MRGTGFVTRASYPSGVPTVAFTGGPIYAFDPATRRWTARDALVVQDGAIASLDARDVGNGVRTVDLDGAALVPAFADAHVHLTETGRYLGERDLSAVRDAATFARRIAALPRGRFVIAGNYDDATWTDGGRASAAPLDAHHPDALAMAVRVDGHSCVLNRAALAFAGLPPDLPGIERDADGAPTGRLALEANWRAQTALLGAEPAAERRAADRRATELALRAGALHLHVQLIGFARDAYAAEIATLADAGAAKWYPKICERDPALARGLGLPYVGGDVFLDGSIGSGTAALCAPYADRDGDGVLMHDDAEVERYFAEAERLGVSAGVHAIGDRAIEQLLRIWERVLGGRPSPRCRHFVEHFEIARPDQIERAARLGLYLSVQPQFDATWGAPGGMYETRLGAERAATMNAFGSARRAGATLAGGDDSPVCRLAPLEGMRAAHEHQRARERLDAGEALAMYTWDAARFGHVETRTGRLAPGYAADLVVLAGDPLASGSFADVRVAQTWRDGERVA